MADENHMIVVGIGASAGGLSALEDLFKALPPNIGMAFVVIQHLDPKQPSHMADVIRRYTKMPVVEAADQMAFEANTVYIPPSDKYLAIHNNQMKLIDPAEERIRLPIDFFFRSLAESKGDRSVGIVLSGSGADGTLGVREIRCAGGMVIAQEPKTAEFDRMPVSAIDTGMVDFILPPKEIGTVLVSFAENAFQAPVVEIPESHGILEKVSPILDLIAKQTNQNFHAYRKSTVCRRILRRMSIVRCDTFDNYLALLTEKPEEVGELAKDLLVSVTSFFRDPEAFEELRDKAIRPLVREATASQPIRIWVAGCATGEEAYSIAMLVLEERQAVHKKVSVNIFASDLDAEGLKIGRAGIYPESIALDISEERLQRFFTKTDHTYQINKEVREMVTFAVQNLVSDPPFSKLDVISCRNVLIYFEPVLQRRIAQLFAFALKPGGYLFLGKSDSMGGTSLRDQFEPVSTRVRLYKRSGSAPPLVPGFLSMVTPEGKVISRAAGQPRERRQPNFADMLNRAFLSRFGASAVITAASGAIVYLVGQLRKYLDFPSGTAEFNLFDMLGSHALRRLRPALHRAIHEEKTVTLERVEFSPGNIPCLANVTVVPISKDDEKLAAVLFEQLGETSVANFSVSRGRENTENDEESSTTTRLENELRALADDFHLTVSDYEASSEELKAANEEITSMNEELQSTNEELETSKEEIQAANEELMTVNQQLTLKIEESNRLNDDLTNFINASDIAIVFLDTDCYIKRFTPPAKKLFNFTATDLGRPLDDISNKLSEIDFSSICRKVLDDLVSVQNEIQSSERDWYLMRCLPYRTESNKIDGVVLTFVDITDRKKAELELNSLNQALEKRVAERVGALRLLEARSRAPPMRPRASRMCSDTPWRKRAGTCSGLSATPILLTIPEKPFFLPVFGIVRI